MRYACKRNFRFPLLFEGEVEEIGFAPRRTKRKKKVSFFAIENHNATVVIILFSGRVRCTLLAAEKEGLNPHLDGQLFHGLRVARCHMQINDDITCICLVTVFIHTDATRKFRKN